jgi:hypothetical protein
MKTVDYVILPSRVDGQPVLIPTHDVVDRISEIRFLQRMLNREFAKWKKAMNYE